jgi:hypothetical protein
MQAFVVESMKNYDEKSFKQAALAGRVQHWTEPLSTDVVVRDAHLLPCGMSGCGRGCPTRVDVPNGYWVMTCPEHREFATEAFIKLSRTINLWLALAELDRISKKL